MSLDVSTALLERAQQGEVDLSLSDHSGGLPARRHPPNRGRNRGQCVVDSAPGRTRRASRTARPTLRRTVPPRSGVGDRTRTLENITRLATEVLPPATPHPTPLALIF